MSKPGPIKTWLVTLVWNRTPTCAEMCRLASRACEAPLPTSTRLRIWLHHLICVWCKRYQRQIEFLHRAGPGLAGRETDSSRAGLPEAARQRILSRLRKASENL